MRVRLAVILLLLAPALAMAADDLDAVLGKALFKRNWVPAPSSTDAANGLGPLFNARSCVTCHKNGGPARLTVGPDGQRTIRGAVVRLGDEKGRGDPFYGVQIQTAAVPGLDSEGQATFLPKFKIALSGPSLSAGVKAGARLAPSLVGRAQFEQIADDEILKRADPDDRDGDGIKGRARRLGPDGASGPVGRFGWKAAHATLDEQVSSAFALDLGLSSPLDPRPYGDCTALEVACLKAPNGQSAKLDGHELSAQMVGLVSLYLASLAPPPGSDGGEGRRLFEKTGCAACHVPELNGKSGLPVRTFSDLLLHDMGPGLDDGVGEPGVASSLWRTAPLLDLDARGGERRFLHDGRASTLAQAIAQHGGEAGTARRTYQGLNEDQKQKLISYLKHL